MQKKSLLALAALVLASGAAVAQSSVTVFGVMDVAARNMKGDDSVKLLNNEGRAQSRLGFRGVEDMGGGLKAAFWLEHGLLADAGGQTDAARFWGRRATVSLMGGFGEIRLGRQKYASRLVIDDFDPFATSGMVDITRGFSGLAFTKVAGVNTVAAGASTGGWINRGDNVVQYHLPAMGSFYGTVDVAGGEGADPALPGLSNKGMSGRLGFRDKAMHVALGYGQFGTADKLKTWTLGGSYVMGGMTLQGSYTKNTRASFDQTILAVGGSYTMGSGKFIVSFAKSDGNGAFAATNTNALIRGQQATDNRLFALGYDYSLSKRTTLYTTYGSLNNAGAARFTLAGASGASAISAASPLGRDSTGYEVGVRHNF